VALGIFVAQQELGHYRDSGSCKTRCHNSTPSGRLLTVEFNFKCAPRFCKSLVWCISRCWKFYNCSLWRRWFNRRIPRWRIRLRLRKLFSYLYRCRGYRTTHFQCLAVVGCVGLAPAFTLYNTASQV
jgi:hypothetical protein